MWNTSTHLYKEQGKRRKAWNKRKRDGRPLIFDFFGKLRIIHWGPKHLNFNETNFRPGIKTKILKNSGLFGRMLGEKWKLGYFALLPWQHGSPSNTVDKPMES